MMDGVTCGETTLSVDWQAGRRRFERHVRFEIAAPTIYDLEAWAAQLEPLLVVPKVESDNDTSVLTEETTPGEIWFGYLDDLADDKRDEWLAACEERGWRGAQR
jgi:hypothetical protein